MLDVSIVNKTSPEANWNRRTGKPRCWEAAPPKTYFAKVDWRVLWHYKSMNMNRPHTMNMKKDVLTAQIHEI